MHKSASWLLLLSLASQTVYAKWAMTLRPAEERARACQEQVSFCYSACGSVARTNTNFCNVQTMGWDCACESKATEAKVRHYEWPMAIAECRAALNMCNDGCAASLDAQKRPLCFTSCASDYQCSTPAAPVSSLRVKSANEKPAGYVPPTDSKVVELSMGMKFGTGNKSGDLGSLPKAIPQDDADQGSNEDDNRRHDSGKYRPHGIDANEGRRAQLSEAGARWQLVGSSVPLYVLAGALALGNTVFY
ncbi:hypothetical protein LPJ78_003588 [Coemansia sp. RSA 989]|nr:hypothetical protein LPJ68_002706 [Coemansia sp. RSA 1086]KAJ1749834.1 hypothetical protein LPJ79_003399 [Coemansia sp. RSA 1821]KAJ1864119.1 hypothetical protein LPJ78_003588 [Coemansia sp. RSA 989]